MKKKIKKISLIKSQKGLLSHSLKALFGNGLIEETPVRETPVKIIYLKEALNVRSLNK